MTYDHWKTTEPDQFVDHGQCSKCGSKHPIHKMWGEDHSDELLCDGCFRIEQSEPNADDYADRAEWSARR
jgi:hypothetical protein